MSFFRQISDDLCLHAGARIVTSFTHLATEFFTNLDPNKSTSVSYVSGSVEAACALGLAEAIGEWKVFASGLQHMEMVSCWSETQRSHKESTPEAHLLSSVSHDYAGCLWLQVKCMAARGRLALLCVASLHIISVRSYGNITPTCNVHRLGFRFLGCLIHITP